MLTLILKEVDSWRTLTLIVLPSSLFPQRNRPKIELNQEDHVPFLAFVHHVE